MTKSQYLKIIKQVDWYRQGGEVFWFYGAIPYQSVSESIGFDRCIVHQRGRNNSGYFDRAREGKKFRALLTAQKRDRLFIDRQIKDWEKLSDDALRVCSQAFKKDIADWTDTDLTTFLKNFNDKFLAAWKRALLIEWSDPDGLKILKEFISSQGVTIGVDDLEAFTSQMELTSMQAELVGRAKIVKKQMLGRDIALALRAHTKKFFWYQDNWSMTHNYTEEYFASLLLTNDAERNKLLESARKIFSQCRDRKLKRKKLLQKLKLPTAVKNILYMFSRMADWRDYRKQLGMALPKHYLDKVLVRVCRDNDLTTDLAGMLDPWEITSWKISPEIKRQLGKRWAGGVHRAQARGKAEWLYGKEAKIIYSALQERLKRDRLTGTIANKGIARGPVCIVDVNEDFSKMKLGDVLVSSMTRPEFASLMKMSSAIITNEGGITCHAAIVSRELNKPCIIGTQVATEVLRDGQMVEVDANNGIVKIISN